MTKDPTLCRECGVEPVEPVPGPPWDPAPRPDVCAGCDAAAESAWEELELESRLRAAAGAGRFDLL